MSYLSIEWYAAYRAFGSGRPMPGIRVIFPCGGVCMEWVE